MKHLFKLGNSVSLFFLLLLFASVAMIFSFDDSAVSPYYSGIEVPTIELKDSTIYRINNKKLELTLNAKEARRFEKYDEFFDVILKHQSNDALDTITAPEAILKDEMIYFDKGVNDERNGYNLYSAIATYDMKNSIFTGKTDFKISGESQNIVGEDIFYDAKNKITRATNIKARLRVDKK